MSLLMDTLVDALSWRFNSAALKTGVQLSSSIMLFSGYKARGGLARSGSKSMFSVVRNVHTVFLWPPPPISFPAHSVGGFPVPLALEEFSLCKSLGGCMRGVR